MSKKNDYPPYVTTMHSIGGPKAVLMQWYDDIEGYDAWMTGPGMESPEKARQYAWDWAKTEGIEYRSP